VLLKGPATGLRGYISPRYSRNDYAFEISSVLSVVNNWTLQALSA